MSELSRLRWLCRRGTKELDMIMSRYLEHHYETASMADRDKFKLLLEMPDPDLYDLLLGRSEATDPELRQIVGLLRNMSAQD